MVEPLTGESTGMDTCRGVGLRAKTNKRAIKRVELAFFFSLSLATTDNFVSVCEQPDGYLFYVD